MNDDEDPNDNAGAMFGAAILVMAAFVIAAALCGLLVSLGGY